jgi:amphi-Trp domain-containing protein
MPEEKFVFDSLQDSETIREFIETLREGFEKGRIALSSGSEEILLTPKGLLNFSVKAKKKHGESKINIKIAWKDRDGNVACAPGAQIKIEH